MGGELFLGSQIWDSASNTKVIIEKTQISMSYHIKIWSHEHVLIETPIEPGTRPFQVLPNHHWNGPCFDAGKAMFHDQDLLGSGIPNLPMMRVNLWSSPSLKMPMEFQDFWCGSIISICTCLPLFAQANPGLTLLLCSLTS